MCVDTIFLTSFLKRDECFSLLDSQLKKLKVMQMIDSQIINEAAVDLGEKDSHDECDFD